jgi:hypothetical protein
VRLVIAETVFAAVSGKGQVMVRVRGIPEPQVMVTPLPEGGLPADVTALLAGFGIRALTDGHGISIRFPGPAELPTEDA